MFTIGKNQGKFDIESKIGINYTGVLLNILSEQDVKANRKRVFPILEMDKLPSWYRANQESLEPYHNNAKQMAKVTKALALELLVTNFLSYHDMPMETRCHCSTAFFDGLERPVGFAAGGLPDLSVCYDDISVIGEVSTRRKPSIEHYLEQLINAYKHAVDRNFCNGSDKPVYCLMVNERSLSQSDTKRAFDIFTRKVNEKHDNIKFLSVSIQELASIAVDLNQEQTQDMSQSEMVSLIKQLSDLCQDDTSSLDNNWFQKTWVETISNRPEPEPPSPSFGMGM